MPTITTCRSSLGGKPKCGLGCLQKNLNVEIQGISFSKFYNVFNRIKDDSVSPKERTYNVFIVLEGVTDEDDKNNTPISSSMAKRLIEAVLQAGFDTSQVYITNLVKCAPPKGRKASQKEIKACREHLKIELEKFKPEVVLLVGSTAMRAFNLHNEGGIFKNRGKVFNVKFPEWERSPSFKVIPTFHPSMFFYKNDPVAERRMQDDYILAATLSKNEIPKTLTHKINYKLIKNTEDFNWFLQQISGCSLVAFDTESRSLNTLINPMTTMSFSWGYEPDNPEPKTAILPITRHSPVPNRFGWYVEPFWGTNKYRMELDNIYSELRINLFENEKISKAAHNIKYDWQVIRKWASCELKGTLYDTCLMHHLIREQRPHDLGYLSDLELGLGNYSERVDNLGDKLKTYDRIPDHILWPYAAFDAENTFRLACRFYQKLKKSKNPKIFDLYLKKVMPAIEAFVDLEWHGIRMNKEKALQYKEAYEKEKESILSSLKQKTGNPDFNPSSPDDVKDAAIKAGFSKDLQDTTKVSGFVTDRASLRKIESKWDVAGEIIQYRTIRKMLSTYLERAFTELDEDGRIRKSFLLHGTESGRVSCGFLHQIPKPSKSGSKNLRDLFEAEENNLFVYMDYKQIELKVYSILIEQLTGDDALCKIFFDPSIDSHKKMASEILGIPENKVSKINRELGKCYSGDTELLTPIGWKRIEDVTGNEKVMQWDPNGKLSFSNINGIYKFNNETLNHYTDRHTDLLITPDHLQILRDKRTKQLVVKEIQNFSTPFLDSSYAIHAGKYEGNYTFSDLLTRVLVMVQADGSYESDTIRFGFSKKRKIARCIKLLESLGAKFTVNKDKNNVTSINWSARCEKKKLIYKEMPEKKFTWDLVWKVDREAFLDEIPFWDGRRHKTHKSDKGKSGFSRTLLAYFSSIKKNVDIVQTIAVLSDRKTTTRKIGNLGYKVSYRKEKSSEGRCSWTKNGIQSSDGNTVHCVSVDSGFLLTRRNGKVTVSNNCFNFGAVFGSTGSDLVGKEYEHNGKLYPMTWDMVDRALVRFHTMYPSVKGYLEAVPDIARNQNGTYVNVFGRERHLGDALFSRDPAKRGAAERELVNFTVQSAAAQITIDTAVKFYSVLKKFRATKELDDNKAFLVNTVHDSLMIEVHKELKDWALPILQTIAERPIPELNNRKFTVDSGIGKTWSEAES